MYDLHTFENYPSKLNDQFVFGWLSSFRWLFFTFEVYVILWIADECDLSDSLRLKYFKQIRQRYWGSTPHSFWQWRFKENFFLYVLPQLFGHVHRPFCSCSFPIKKHNWINNKINIYLYVIFRYINIDTYKLNYARKILMTNYVSHNIYPPPPDLHP